VSRFLAAFRAGGATAVSPAPKSGNPEKGENSQPATDAGEFLGFSPFSDFGSAESAVEAGCHDGAERAAMAEHYAAPPDPYPWRPGDPDPLRDGLLAGWHASRRVRLATLAQRLREARPKREHGVRQLDWQAWEDAAREAAGLPSGAWSAWRAAVGTEGAP
jgi:hypothetical protein